jgi:hypothetical protein
MVDKTIMDMPDLGEAPADGDFFEMVDVSDDTDSPSGTSKRVSKANLIAGIGGASGRTLIDTQTLVSAGQFDFGPLLAGAVIPQTYQSLAIDFVVRSSGGTTEDQMYLFMNDDVSNGNYWTQENIAVNGGPYGGKADYPRVALIAGNGSPANSYSRGCIVLGDYRDAWLKSARCSFTTYMNTDQIATGVISAHHTTMTAAITRLRLRADGHDTDGLLGVARLYGIN